MNDAFLNRFQRILRRNFRVRAGQLVVNTLLLVLTGIVLIATVDYCWELDRTSRAIAVTIWILGTILLATMLGRQTGLRWSPPTTAAEIEAIFPQLGQSVRTTVQFSAMQADQVQQEGVTTSLVAALAERTHYQALPLTLEDIIPTARLRWSTAAAVIGFLCLAGATAADWQFRTALQRIVLMDASYRQLDVRPGDQTIAEGASVEIDATVTGRSDGVAVLRIRPMEGADRQWSEHPMPAVENDVVGNPPAHIFQTTLPRLSEPVEYQVVAGHLSSSVYQIDIRRPLRIRQARIELHPPRYTTLPTVTTSDFSLSGLKGTVVKYAIEFDKPVKSASLAFSRRGKGSSLSEVIPLAFAEQEQTASTAIGRCELTLEEDRYYGVQAEATDGTSLALNKYRLRVRFDQPPQIAFDEPADAVEVHTLAELMMRVRVKDDYGLARVGVVFQINNEPEIALMSRDFPVVAAAAEELSEYGKISLTTQIALEKVLPLEVFELTQKDSVMYFAFAEDNQPDKPHRTETELRYIDIRPFKRTYQVIDPDPMAGMNSGVKTLEELIQRQRFALNRTLQIEKQAVAGRSPEAPLLNQLMQYETELAGNVRQLAEALERFGLTDTELLYQAEASILQSVDSLSVAKWENATLQMKDALKAMIEQRNRTAEQIFKNPDPALLEAFRRFDRLQSQKLRRPKTDKEEAREVIRRLQELIEQEKGVASALEEPDATPPEADSKPKEGQE